MDRRLLVEPIPARARIDGRDVDVFVTGWARRPDGWHAWCRLPDGRVRLVHQDDVTPA